MVSTRLEDLRDSNKELIKTIEAELTEELARRGIQAEVRGRQKQPYSVWSKMERKSVAFEQLSDIFGFRVVVNSLDDCYRTIGVVHMKWPMVPGRFKDYVSTPKQNDYRSIHTTVVGPGRQRVELQVRTHEMHDIARHGIAAHALYKDGHKAAAPVLSHESSAYQWLKRTIDMLADGDNPEEFLEHTRLELFHDQVFCFTPKGRLIALPRGATPIDFGYAVHTSVGNSAVGVKINGRLSPLLAPLNNGDEVEIIRAEGQTPPAAWESIAITGKARAAIRRASRAAVRAQYAGLGRQIVLRAFERGGKAFSEDKLKAALPRLARGNVEDMLAAVGRGEMFSGDVVKAVYPDFKEERKSTLTDRTDPGWFTMQKASGVQFKSPGAPDDARPLPIRGLHGDLPVSFAPEGGAVPGDRIVGILTPGEGVIIYPIQSPALAHFDDQPERWLDVRWDVEDSNEFFPAKIVVAAINEPGSLGAVAGIIGELGANIDDIKFDKQSPDYRLMIFEIGVVDLKHLMTILSRLRTLPMVHTVQRTIG
jgi:GTP pyrophosphokinase